MNKTVINNRRNLKNTVIIGFLIMIGFSGKAQDFEYKNYKWDSIPFFSYNLDNYKEYEAYGLKTKYLLEYVYDKTSGELFTYYTVHRKYLVLSNDAIDGFNKIYISMNDVKELIDIKARFISSDNKVTYVDKKNIKEIKNKDTEESGYQQFAIEGASTPGIIEYYYVLKKEAQISGKYWMQSTIPSYNVEFEIYSPSNLKMLTKGYNGFTTPKDTLLEDKKKWHYYTKMDSVPALPKEQYALNDANKQRVEFTIAYNLAQNSSRLKSLDDACHSYYSFIYDEENKHAKALKKTLKTIDVKGLPEEQAVRKIEDWVKNNIALVDGVKVEARDITGTVNNKYTNKMGMLVLLVNLYQTAEIPIELVGTCDRNDRQFDASFDGWNFIDNLLLYFPNLKKYMEPSEYEYRLGYFSSNYFNNYGVFMSTIKVDNLTSFKYKSKKIVAPPYTQNGDSLEVYVSLDDEMTTLKATLKKTLVGQAAAAIQPYYRLMEPDKKQKFAQLFTALSDVLTFDSYSVKNDAPEDLLVKPFIIEGKGHGSLVEQAGNKYIVKLGQIIGPQSELYNVKKRHQPVDVQSIHYYYRKIVFDIPEGYAVADITPMDINVALKDGETPSAGFISKATRVGNTIVVEISEYYKSLEYPIEQFESFRNVINAAADFNKRSLVLEKK
jgi:hypothetical protein